MYNDYNNQQMANYQTKTNFSFEANNNMSPNQPHKYKTKSSTEINYSQNSYNSNLSYELESNDENKGSLLQQLLLD